ncbi:MAG: glycosyltransferase family 9 protein [Rhodospirillaceae bacterium]
MSFGDEIMASGHARVAVARRSAAEPGVTFKAVVLDRAGQRRWHGLWRDLPWIVQPGETWPQAQTVAVRNGAQCRPYIRYPFTIAGGQRWTTWRARDHVGAIELTAAERAYAETQFERLGDYVLVEPNLTKSNHNKNWGWHNWQRLVELLDQVGLQAVQVGPAGTPLLKGAHLVITPTFRAAAAVLERAMLSILPEGGLHHAAAALARPAIVLFGGYITPQVTGYPDHVNLADDGPSSPCGRWLPCTHCAEVWSRLDARDVAARVVRFVYYGQASAA